MASLRSGTRKDGSTYVQVLYRLDGKQTSTSFEDMASAAKFQRLARKFGPASQHQSDPKTREQPTATAQDASQLLTRSCCIHRLKARRARRS